MTIAATVWRPADGNGEYGAQTPENIVDPSSNNLVDPSGNQIVSTESAFTSVADTIWVEDESA